MSFKGGPQQTQQSMYAGGENTHVMHHATLYVIHDGEEVGRVSPFPDTSQVALWPVFLPSKGTYFASNV